MHEVVTNYSNYSHNNILFHIDLIVINRDIFITCTFISTNSHLNIFSSRRQNGLVEPWETSDLTTRSFNYWTSLIVPERISSIELNLPISIWIIRFTEIIITNKRLDSLCRTLSTGTIIIWVLDIIIISSHKCPDMLTSWTMCETDTINIVTVDIVMSCSNGMNHSIDTPLPYHTWE